MPEATTKKVAFRSDRVSGSRTRLVAALLITVSFAPALAQKPAERPNITGPDFSKEAYTIERLACRISAEGNGTGSREVTAEVKILADAGVKTFAVLNFTYTSANETAFRNGKAQVLHRLSAPEFFP